MKLFEKKYTLSSLNKNKICGYWLSYWSAHASVKEKHQKNQSLQDTENCT